MQLMRVYAGGKQYVSAASHLFSTENFPALMKSNTNTMNSNVLLQ